MWDETCHVTVLLRCIKLFLLKFCNSAYMYLYGLGSLQSVLQATEWKCCVPLRISYAVLN